MRWMVLTVVVASCGGPRSSPVRPSNDVELRRAGPTELLAVTEFDAIADRAERSRALFAEASRVLRHPRCINCHPSGDIPHQRLAMELHDPPVVRGPANNGVPGMECTTCHQDRNQELNRVPGAPSWQLAPIGMAWAGKSIGEICEQLKDPARNGGRSMSAVVDHSSHDPLVAWGWHPGADREPPPGTQEQFGALMAAWVETGAECPEDNR